MGSASGVAGRSSRPVRGVYRTRIYPYTRTRTGTVCSSTSLHVVSRDLTWTTFCMHGELNMTDESGNSGSETEEAAITLTVSDFKKLKRSVNDTFQTVLGSLARDSPGPSGLSVAASSVSRRREEHRGQGAVMIKFE